MIEINSINWRSLSLGKLTPVVFNMELTHLGSEASNYQETTPLKFKYLLMSCPDRLSAVNIVVDQN